MKHLIYLMMILCFADVGFAKSETDTISNWQVYKDSILLFKSHMLDSHQFVARIRKSDEYTILRVSYNSCIKNHSKKFLELVYNDKRILAIKWDRTKNTIEISKELIEKSIGGYLEKKIVLKYYDDSSPHGQVLGLLIFENE